MDITFGLSLKLEKVVTGKKEEKNKVKLIDHTLHKNLKVINYYSGKGSMTAVEKLFNQSCGNASIFMCSILISRLPVLYDIVPPTTEENLNQAKYAFPRLVFISFL